MIYDHGYILTLEVSQYRKINVPMLAIPGYSIRATTLTYVKYKWSFKCIIKSLICKEGRSYLGDSDRAFLGQFLLGLLTGIRITEVGVEVFVQDLGGLFVEVSSFPPVKREQGAIERERER